MKRYVFCSGAGVAVTVLACVVAGAVQEQAPKKAAARGAPKVWIAPRTPEGQPDLQGVWDFSTVTPLERPAMFAGREFLTDEEIVKVQQQAAAADLRFDETPELRKGGDVGAYNSFWLARGTTVVATKRTSIIVDPPDGRMPPLTPTAQAIQNAREQAKQHPAGPEDLDLIDRCIVGVNSGPPMLPDIDNNTVHIVQSRDHVVVLNEMVHHARIIPLHGPPHLGDAIQQWTGDSRGHWESNVLVVDTTNFSDEGLSLDFVRPSHFRGFGGKHTRVTERFTRLRADLLLYEFTIDDPAVHTKPWSGSMTMTRIRNRVYEYACHEGNYGLANLLSNARAEERPKSK